jgi:GT2 family glycosyltransferase
MSYSSTFKDTSAANIAVIILTVNQRDSTLQCLSSLIANYGCRFKVLLWDNGSLDGTSDAVKRIFPDVLVHYHKNNIGVASGRNKAAELAIKSCNPTHLLFLDNDILVEPNFIKELLQPFKSDSTLGQTQAKLRFMHDKDRLNDGGGCQINFWLGRIKPVGYREIDHGQYDKPRRCVSCGGAMMVRTDVFQQLGGFDSQFDPFGPEDIDFSLRLAKAGYGALYVPQALAYHAVSHTFGEGYDEDYARHKSRHWFLLMERHAHTWEKIVFMTFIAPCLFLKVIIRESRKGNISAVRGLINGFFE